MDWIKASSTEAANKNQLPEEETIGYRQKNNLNKTKQNKKYQKERNGNKKVWPQKLMDSKTRRKVKVIPTQKGRNGRTQILSRCKLWLQFWAQSTRNYSLFMWEQKMQGNSFYFYVSFNACFLFKVLQIC